MLQKRLISIVFCFIILSFYTLAQTEAGYDGAPRKFIYNVCTGDTTSLNFPPLENVIRVWPADLDPLIDFYGDTVRVFFENSADTAVIFNSFISRVYVDTMTPPNVTGIVNDTLILVILPAIQEALPDFMNYSVCPGDTVTVYYPYVPYGYMYVTPPDIGVLDTLSGSPRLYLFPDSATVYNLYIRNIAGCELGPFPLTVSLDADPALLNLNIFDELCLNSDSFLLDFSPENSLITGAGVGSDGYFRPWEAGLGNHIITMQSNLDFCNTTIQKTIKIFDENYIIFPDLDNLCQNDNSIVLNSATPLGGRYYGSSIVSDSLIKPSLLSPGLYEIEYRYRGGDGCYYPKIQNFYVKAIPPKPNLLIFGDSVACAGDTVILGSSLYAFKYIWNTNDTTQYIKAYNYGNYYVSIDAANGCRNNSDTLFLGFNPPPEISLDSPLQINGYNVSAPGASDGSIYLSANGGLPPYSFIWSNGEITEVLTGLNSGQYVVFVTDSGSCAVSDTIFLSDPLNTSIDYGAPLLLQTEIKIPNSFTPNGDGFNDTWRLGPIPSSLERNDLMVFDKTGLLVYRMRNYVSQWDGIDNNGFVSPNGTYLWVLRFDDSPYMLSGTIDLIR